MDYKKDYLNIEGKSAIVTGGGRGIGKEIAVQLAKYGVKVAICEINSEWGQDTVDEIVSKGGTACFIKCDVSYPISFRSQGRF